MTMFIVDEDPDMLNELPRGSCARDNVPNHGLQIPRVNSAKSWTIKNSLDYTDSPSCQETIISS